MSPPVDQRGFAGFIYEELSWPHVTFQFGGRVDRTNYDIEVGESREFTEVSASAGLLLQPAAANDRVTVAFSVARAARNPALEELYFFGNHLGNFAFEIGNPELEAEHGIGFDASLRWRTTRASGEVTFFRNAISNYIFRNPISEAQFAARLADLEDRFPDRDVEEGLTTELQRIEFTARDSVLQGIEAHTDVTLVPQLIAEIGVDYVRGRLQDTDDPLPRIPPFRVRAGLRYQYNAFQAGGEIVHAAEQDRVFGEETPTDGYTIGKIFAAYSIQAGPTTHTVTARLDNVADTTYRNHLSSSRSSCRRWGGISSCCTTSDSDYGFHVHRHRRSDFERRAGDWMKKPQAPRVQRRPRDSIVGHAIGRVADDRPAARGKMHADLVGASGYQLASHQRQIAARRDHLVPRRARKPIVHCRHDPPIVCVAAKRELDRAVARGRRSNDDCEVLLLERVSLQARVNAGGERHQQNA